MDKHTFINEFLMRAQDHLAFGIKSFLDEISEDSKYCGEEVAGICCLYNAEEFFYLGNDGLKQMELADLPEPSTKPLHECSAAEIAAGIIITDNSYTIQEYLKSIFLGRSHSKTWPLPMTNTGLVDACELMIVFVCSDLSGYAKHPAGI